MALPHSTPDVEKNQWKVALAALVLFGIACLLGWFAFGNFLAILWHSVKLIVEGWFSFSFLVGSCLVIGARKRRLTYKDYLWMIAGPIGVLVYVIRGARLGNSLRQRLTRGQREGLHATNA